MDASQAIDVAINHVRSTGMDYPTDGLAADRFETGWHVYAPVHVDTSDPMAFLDIPIGRAAFLVGDSGRIEQTSSSVPPQQAWRRFSERERALAVQTESAAGAADFMSEFRHGFEAAGGRGEAASFSVVGGDAARHDAEIRERASGILDDVARQLARAAPPGWQRLRAEFAFTVRAELATAWFATGSGWQPPTKVPAPVLDTVRQHRHLSAQMTVGPWWRLILEVTSAGRLSVSYDYGDDPLPANQLQPADNYREDVARYPRVTLPLWLAAYLAGPEAQSRDARTADGSARADATDGRAAVATDDVEPLPQTWARWAVLAAVHVGAGSQWGPRIEPGAGWYESAARSGSTLYLLPGDRAVLSGGRWNSPLLAEAYLRGGQLPDLYRGAPAWVNDAVLNTRNRNGLLSFCYWWSNGQWWRGGADTFDELDDPMPAIWTSEETVTAMVGVVGPEAEPACQALLAAADQRTVRVDDVAAVFARFSAPDVEAALRQLALAGSTG